MRMSTAIREQHIGGYRELTPDGISGGQPTPAIRRVGFWSAVVATVSTIGYAIAQPLTSPLTNASPNASATSAMTSERSSPLNTSWISAHCSA